jgi:tripartite ATP-independent transporter DctM subunit
LSEAAREAPVGGPTRVLRLLEQGALIGALGLLALFPLVEALGRPLGGFHIPGGAAYVQQLVLWIAFLGGLLTTREGKHLTLSTTEFMGHGALRRATGFVTALLSAVVLAVLCYAAVQLVAANRIDGKTLPIGVPEWVSECVMPLALGLMALRFAWSAGRGWAARAVAGLVLLASAIPLLVRLGLLPERALALLQPLGDAIVASPWAFGLLVGGSILLGTPIFVAMGGLALLLFFKDDTPVAAVSAEVYRLMASPTLPAIPLLTACGYVLAEGGASSRLLRFFRALFGWLPGGLAVMVAAVCALFTTFTGGSGVTIIAVGGLVLPILIEDRYPEDFSLGLVTAAGSLGLLFPPSLPVILYSVVASAGGDVSVPADALYLAGLLPGLLMLGLVAGYGMWVGRRSATQRQAFSWRELGAATWVAKWELLLPVVIVGVFAAGWASMVETAALALTYAVIVQCFITRDLDLRRGLPHALVSAGALMGAILILLSVAMGLTSYMVDAQVAQALLEWVKSHIDSRLVFLLALNAFLLVVGCLVDIFSAIVVVVPLITPIAAAYGVHPVHLGIVFLANLELGYLTPPVGMNLFLSSSRFERPLVKVYRDTLPFLFILTLGVLFITYVPEMTVGVLKLLGKDLPAAP